MENYVVYWVHLPEHVNYNTQGYVGISCNFNKRLISHNYKAPNSHFGFAMVKYGWGNLIKEVLAENLDKEAAALLEEMLRPEENIGWNIAVGGGVPPSNLGNKHSEETRSKISVVQRANGHKPSEMAINKSANNRRGKLGADSNRCKHLIIATNIITGDVLRMCGTTEITLFGFNFSLVYRCLSGYRKSHKGYTFTKEIL